MLKYAKMLLAVAILFVGFTATAQPPVMMVVNNTSCNLQISIVETDFFCSTGTNPVVNLAPFSVTPINGTAPSTQWAYCKIYNNPICTPTGPNLNVAYIGQACGPYPIKDYYVATAPCNACQSGIKARFTSASMIQIW